MVMPSSGAVSSCPWFAVKLTYNGIHKYGIIKQGLCYMVFSSS